MKEKKTTFAKVAKVATSQVKNERSELNETIRVYTNPKTATPEKMATLGQLFDIPSNIVAFSSKYNTKDVRARLFETAPYIVEYANKSRTFARRSWAWYHDTPNTWAKCYTLTPLTDYANIIKNCATRVHTNAHRTKKPLTQFVGQYGVYYTTDGADVTTDIYRMDKDGNYIKIEF